ncbi:thiamine diphosphokinase [Sedimentitalea nanhaiensis]|uniref:Thiamine diphosphokinase n=1 Tax=Sedimentitalea nanhaiensis TaxID=999627 RepID=A0A1I7E1F3_9RHOB|nr:thiamine diphosphokinase [Sedimentitalea nanhaiensis]SFU17693.1 thiamine diphosphokinase [Sedimentitalea nanhaiensis]
MKNTLVFSKNPVTLVGGGDVGAEDIELALGLAPEMVAADGGAANVLDAGHMPFAVIGDFDSIAPTERARIPQDRQFVIHEQASTDFDKALRSISAPVVLAVGFLGGRVDHQLAAFNVLVRHADRPCILIGVHELVFHIPEKLDLDLAPGDVVSLYPMAPVTGRSSGLEWPIDGLTMAPDGQIGTSNRALGPVSLRMEGPGMLGIVPRSVLRHVMQAIAKTVSVPAAP